MDTSICNRQISENRNDKKPENINKENAKVSTQMTENRGTDRDGDRHSHRSADTKHRWKAPKSLIWMQMFGDREG